MKPETICAIACAEKGDTIDEELIAKAADIRLHEVTEALASMGLKHMTRGEALCFIVKQSPTTVLLLAESYNNSVSQNRRDTAAIDSLIERLDRLEGVLIEKELTIERLRKEKVCGRQVAIILQIEALQQELARLEEEQKQ